MPNYPRMIPTINMIERSPRRVRGVFAGETIFDTSNALYVWEWAGYPQYYVPLSDVKRSGSATASIPVACGWTPCASIAPK